MINNFVFCNILISCASFPAICWPGNETSKSIQITLLCAWTDLPGDFVLILACWNCRDVGSTSRTKTTGKANKCSLVKSSFTLPIGYKTHGSISAFGVFFVTNAPFSLFATSFHVRLFSVWWLVSRDITDPTGEQGCQIIFPAQKMLKTNMEAPNPTHFELKSIDFYGHKSTDTHPNAV